jgi:hypothetical protein
MVELYFSAGHIDPGISADYGWPGFFVLIRVCLAITGLRQDVVAPLYLFISGLLLSSSVFLMAQKAGFEGFWGVMVYTIIGFFFLDYQFVPQTMALVFLMLLLQRERAQRSRGGFLLDLVLIVALAVVHAFIGVFYVVYLLTMAVSDRSYLRKAAIAGLAIVIVNIYLIASLPYVTAISFTSLLELWGLAEYRGKLAATLGLTSPFQPLSRLCVLSAAGVSLVGIVGAVRRRRLPRQDKALIGSSILLTGIGAGVSVIGLRALQLAAVVAGAGGAFFPRIILNRKVRVSVLLFLAVSSVFLVLHTNYQSYQYQTPESAAGAAFASTSIRGTGHPGVTVFCPYALRGFFGYPSGLEAYDESDLSAAPYLNSTDFIFSYAFISEISSAAGNTQYPPSVADLLAKGNRLFSYGGGTLYGIYVEQTILASRGLVTAGYNATL